MATTAPVALPLRARGPQGGPPKSLDHLTTHSTLEDLDCAVRIAFGIKENIRLAYLAGFPPKPLGPAPEAGEEEDEDDDEDVLLLGSKLAPNEIITVREDDGTAPTVIQGTGAMKVRGKKKKKNAGAAAAAASSSSSSSFSPSANVHTLHPPSSKRGSPGEGGKAPKRRRVNVAVGSEEDVGALLLNAINGGGGRVGQCMRAVFRKSVEEQYNTTKAEGRLTAAASGQYQITESAHARRADGAAARIEVEFTDIFRKKHRDDVELFQRPVLAGVIAEVLRDEGAREMLKPRNMAGCSPRIFWSLFHLLGRGDVAQHLRQLLPNEDWSFLNQRHRELSEKAQENKRQAEQAKREREARAQARKEEREARMARKKAKEEEKRKRKAEVVEVVDEEEEAGKEEDHDYPDVVSDEWVEVLRAKPLSLNMAKDLATQDGEQLKGRIAEVLQSKGLGLTPPTDEQVASWINECQSQVLEGVMTEVVGEEDEDLLDDLEAARMGTPKDLVLWSGTPSMMVNVIKDEVGEARWGEISERMNDEVVQGWGDKCKKAMEAMPWLTNWATTA